MNKYQNYINGKWVDSSSKETLQVEDPSNTKIIGEVALAKNEEVDLAVDAAKKAFEKRILADMPLIERSRLMRKIADELKKVANEGGNLISHENGKPLAGATKEFNDTAEMFEYYAGLTDKLEGRTIPVANGIFDYTILEPYGVSAQIIPWNYPISMIGRSLSCAVATGNSSVIKTSELTPLSAAHSLAKAFDNAGVPPGIINIICGYGNEAGAQLVSHPDVKHIVFTGSVATGKKILHAAADKAIPAIVELGGKSAGIVFPDANIDKVVESAKYGIFSNAGQICTAMSRLIVHKSIKEEVVKKLSDLTKSMKMGAGYEEGVEFTFNVQPKGIVVDEQGKVAGVKMVKTQLGEPDENGRRRAEEVAGSEHIIEATKVLMAFGFKPHKMDWLEPYGVEINHWGGINAPEKGEFTHQTTNPKIFAGGDIVRGSDLVVTAIFEGRNAAEGIMDYLGV